MTPLELAASGCGERAAWSLNFRLIMQMLTNTNTCYSEQTKKGHHPMQMTCIHKLTSLSTQIWSISF